MSNKFTKGVKNLVVKDAVESKPTMNVVEAVQEISPAAAHFANCSKERKEAISKKFNKPENDIAPSFGRPAVSGSIQDGQTSLLSETIQYYMENPCAEVIETPERLIVGKTEIEFSKTQSVNKSITDCISLLANIGGTVPVDSTAEKVNACVNRDKPEEFMQVIAKSVKRKSTGSKPRIHKYESGKRRGLNISTNIFEDIDFELTKLEKQRRG